MRRGNISYDAAAGLSRISAALALIIELYILLKIAFITGSTACAIR